MKIVTVLLKNGDPAKRVVNFPLERDTFRNKIMEIVEDFDKKSYNNNGKPWKSSRILRLNSFFYIFSFFPFSFFFFSSLFLLLFFFSSFLHFSSFSFLCLLLVWVARNPFFLASISSRFLVTFLAQKIMFLGRFGRYLFGSSFLFFLLSNFFLFFFFFFYFLFFFFFFHFFISFIFHARWRLRSFSLSQ